MKANMQAAANVDDYISAQPREIQKHLKQLRQTIKKTAPGASESISYMMPAYKLQGVLVYFGGCKNHICFYPASNAVSYFKKELAPYKTSKGAIQFPLGQPLPLDLVTRIVTYRVQENLNKTALKVKKK
jgi:uncharacterized protein YdhG (YjbR/CyaY superfamily)